MKIAAKTLFLLLGMIFLYSGNLTYSDELPKEKLPEVSINGVGWYQASFEHFNVQSAQSKEVVLDTGSYLEYVLYTYSKIFKVEVKLEEVISVEIYETRVDFMENVIDPIGNIQYDDGGHSIITYSKGNLSMHNDIKAVCVQIMFNIISDKYEGDPNDAGIPPWLTEGCISYFEVQNIEKGVEFKLGEINRQYLSLAKSIAKENPPKEPLFFIFVKPRDSFYTNEVYSRYKAISWSLIYFMLHSPDDEYKEFLQTYLGALIRGKSWKVAHGNAFNDISKADMENDWKDFINSLN